MIQLLRYLFPKLRLKQRLPLLPLQWSSDHARGLHPSDPELVNLAKGYGLARTDQDAATIIQRHRGKPINEVVKVERRKRRRQGRIKRAWARFKRLL